MKDYITLASFHNPDYAKELQRQLNYMHIDNVIEKGFDFMTQAEDYRVYVKQGQKEWSDVYYNIIRDKKIALKEKDDAEAKAYIESQTIINEDEVYDVGEKLSDILYDIASKYDEFTYEQFYNLSPINDPQEEQSVNITFRLDLTYLADFEDSFARKGNQAISCVDLNNPKELFESDSRCIKPLYSDERRFNEDDEDVEYVADEIYEYSEDFKEACKLIVYDFVKKVKGKIIDGFEVGFKKSGNQLFCVLTKQSVVR